MSATAPCSRNCVTISSASTTKCPAPDAGGASRFRRTRPCSSSDREWRPRRAVAAACRRLPRRSWYTDPEHHGRARQPDAPASRSPPGPAVAADRGLPDDGPAAGGQSAGVDRERQPRPRDRPHGPARDADRRPGRPDAGRPAEDRHRRRGASDGQGTGRPANPGGRPDQSAGDRRDARRQPDARDGRDGARTGGAHDRDRRVSPPRPRARRQGGVAGEWHLARAPLAHRQHRRPAATHLSPRELPRHEGRGQAAAARRGRAHGQAECNLVGPDARNLAPRAEGQDRVAGAAGDDRRAAAVLPAPAAEGDSGGARRGRGQRRQRSPGAGSPMPSFPRPSRRR